MVENPSNPARFIKAASACVWHGQRVLLARRSGEVGRGYWSLPGGKIEVWETAEQAANRELLEETGIKAELSLLLGDFTIQSGAVAYVISCFTGFYVSGEAKAASDSDALEWVRVEELQHFALAPNTKTAILRARELLKL